MTDLINSPARPVSAASLQQTLLEHQAILENASVGILFTRDRLVQHCNPKFSEIYCWPHREFNPVPDRCVFDLSNAPYITLFAALLQKDLAGCKVGNVGDSIFLDLEGLVV